MYKKCTITKDEAIAILHDCAAKNGGWLSSRAYVQCEKTPAISTLMNVLDCNPPTWPQICKIAGVKATFAETLPDVLTEADILRLIDMGSYRMQLVPIPHRQQIALYCIRRIYPIVGERFLKDTTFNRVAHEHLLFGSWFAEKAFGTWSEALKAAGLPVDYSRTISVRPPRGKSADKEAGVMRCTEADLPNIEPVAPDWRTQPVMLLCLEPVVETVTFRHVVHAEYGLRHTEVRACLR